MRHSLLPSLLLALSLLLGLGFAAIPADAAVAPVVGTGILEYSIVKDGVPPTCTGSGPFVVTYDGATARLSVSGSAAECVPIFSLISGCMSAGDGSVVCDKVVGEETILVTLAPDGSFDYLWDAPDFHEEITGTLQRIG